MPDRVDAIDAGREAVYAAEIAAFEGTSYETITRLDELVALAADVTAGAWWPHGEIAVVAARRDARSSSTRQRPGDRPVVRLAAPQMTPATVVHELAHVLAGIAAGHGPDFRRAHVDLAGVAFGDEPSGWLSEAYRSMQLPLGARRWPSPPVAPPAGGPRPL